MSTSERGNRFEAAALAGFASRLFMSAGLDEGKARSVAEILIEADMMGHDTHGLALAPWYLDALAAGGITTDGEPEVLSDRGACVTWNGRMLPGPWLTAKAVDLAVERAASYGTVTIAIGNSHHIGALAAYMPRATERGMLALLSCSTPSAASVAPFGGVTGVFTPNPLAAGIPTAGDPILLDISSSITTMNRAKQLASIGGKFPREWVLDSEGHVTDDPQAAVSGGGTLLPVGGLDHGHKGYGLALLVEALTQGLSGVGRASAPRGTTISVFLQVIDPTAFSGLDAFARETSWLVDACRASAPRPGVDRVRVPGENAMSNRRRALEHGIPLSDSIMHALRATAGKFGLEPPPPLPVH